MSKTIYIAGDSTAAAKSALEKPMSGWGEFLKDHFNEEISIANHAINGRSTKSFLDQGRFHEILATIAAGDYLIIQFGHNDQKVDDPERFTDPSTTYKENLKVYIDKAREKGAIPLLLTSTSRRDFIDGEINWQSIGDYPEAMKEVAALENVPLIDVQQVSAQTLNELGEEESKVFFLHLEAGQYKNYPEGLTDNTHFSEKGAAAMAKIVAEGLFENVPDLKHYKI